MVVQLADDGPGLRVSIGQFASSRDQRANTELIAELARTAAGEGSDVLVLPEVAQVYVDPADDWSVRAEPIGGEFTRSIDTIAEEGGLVVVVGMLESDSRGGKPFNTLYVSDGRRLQHYRKVHLYDAFGFRESDQIQPSDVPEPAIVTVRGFRLGLMTCYDLRFPESARELATGGVDAVVLPAAWVPGPQKRDHWRTLVRARAIENTCYVVGANQCAPVGTGGSVVVDPAGVVLAELEDVVSVVTVELMRPRVAEVRRDNPSLSNRRFAVSRLPTSSMPEGV